MERAATTLGLRFNLDPGAKVELARSINTTAGGKWRTIATQCGPTVSRGAMVQIVADHIRKGNDAPPLRKLLVECLLEGTTAVDFDVLLGLRMQGARV
jgi:hypothetical protein